MERLKTIRPEDWEHPPGFDPGIDQIVLSDTLDQNGKKGTRTRLVRFRAGANTQEPFIHDYDEEVYLLEGDQILLHKDDRRPLARHEQGTYFERPRGTWHGPFTSEGGCLLLELHYY